MISEGMKNAALSGAFVAELARSGVRHAVVCPGSRSTPLALALVESNDIRVWLHVDERSAAFFALGMARSLGAPVAVLCSSGTAAANFLLCPALIALGARTGFDAVSAAALSNRLAACLLLLLQSSGSSLRPEGRPFWWKAVPVVGLLAALHAVLALME